MALQGNAAHLKLLLIGWNAIVLALGLVVLGLGIWMVVDEDSGIFVDTSVPESPVIINYKKVSNIGMFHTLAALLVALGVITVVTAFLGLLGAVLENQCFMGISFVLLFLNLAPLIGVGTYLSIMRDDIDIDQEKLRLELRDRLQKAVDTYDSIDHSKTFMDTVQRKFQCCGAENGAIDYAPALSLPASCSDLYLSTPCLDPYYTHVVTKIGVKEAYHGKMTAGMVVAFTLAGLVIVAMILTLIVCCSVRHGHTQ